jgi:hypothetical protein
MRARAAGLARAALLGLAAAAALPALALPQDLPSRAARCELAAVREAIDTVRGADAAAVRLPLEAVRQAAGRCTRFVLAVTPVDELPRVCAAPESLTMAQTARELRRRMAAIDADALLRSSMAGQACRAAYLHELKTTRVVLRARP